MFIAQLLTNFFLFLFGCLGILFNRNNLIFILICFEVMLLSVNLNLVVSSVYLEDVVGQLFALFILTVAAAESAIGLAIIILYYRILGKIEIISSAIVRG